MNGAAVDLNIWLGQCIKHFMVNNFGPGAKNFEFKIKLSQPDLTRVGLG